MPIPNIDLTDAAQSYGLHYVPKVLHTPKDAMYELFVGDPEAAFSRSDKQIHVYSSLFDAPTAYDQSRFATVGVGPLDTKGKVQFILAHELWHARQDEVDDVGLASSAASRNASVAAHDADKYEKSADRHAATAYRLVKIGE